MAWRGRHHVQGVVEDRCRHQLAHVILLDYALERHNRSAVDLVLDALDERGAVLRLGHDLRL